MFGPDRGVARVPARGLDRDGLLVPPLLLGSYPVDPAAPPLPQTPLTLEPTGGIILPEATVRRFWTWVVWFFDWGAAAEEVWW